jgi:hypothetical protein
MEMFDGSAPTLVVLDDLLEQIHRSILQLLRRISLYGHLSVVFLSRNICPKNSHAHTISLNAHNNVSFNSPRDFNQFAALASQLFGSIYKFAVEAFADAMSDAHGYFIVDLKPQTGDRFRLTTEIFPDEQTYVNVDSRLCKPDGY